MVTKEKLEIGSWIIIVGHPFLTGCTGYITEEDKDVEEFRIRITKNKKGNHVRKYYLWINYDRVVPDRFKDEDDLLALIDLAIDLNDKEWFLQLTEEVSQVGQSINCL